jgi:hypothetical protein
VPGEKGADEPLPKDLRERSQRRLIAYAATGAVGGNIIGPSAPLFLLSLGASPFLIGLLATALSLGSLARVVGVWIMPRLGKVGVIAWGRIFGSSFTLLLIPLALLSSLEPGVKALIALALVALRHISVQSGGGAWWPLVQDNIGSSLSSFVIRQRMTKRFVAILMPIAIGAYLGSHPAAKTFAVPFLAAAVVSFAGAFLVRSVSQRPTPISYRGLWSRFGSVLREPAIRRYCICFSVCAFVHMATVPFWVVVLRARGLPANYYVWMMSLEALGGILSLYVWGRLVELYGTRGPLTLALLLQALMAPFWLYLPSDLAALTLFAATYYLFFGIVTAGTGFGDTRAMMDSVPEENRGEAFAVANYAHAIGGGLGGFAGGLSFEWISGLAPGSASIQPSLIYLASMQLVILGGLWLSRRLVNYQVETPAHAMLRHALSRPLRRRTGQ